MLILAFAFSDTATPPPNDPMVHYPTLEIGVGNSWNYAPLSGSQPAWYASH